MDFETALEVQKRHNESKENEQTEWIVKEGLILIVPSKEEDRIRFMTDLNRGLITKNIQVVSYSTNNDYSVRAIKSLNGAWLEFKELT